MFGNRTVDLGLVLDIIRHVANRQYKLEMGSGIGASWKKLSGS